MGRLDLIKKDQVIGYLEIKLYNYKQEPELSE